MEKQQLAPALGWRTLEGFIRVPHDICRYMARVGAKAVNKPTKFAARNKRIVKDFRKGVRVVRIAEDHGITRIRVYQILRQYGVWCSS